MNAVRPKGATRILWALAALFLVAGAAAQTTTDYDDDNDNLIDIRTLAQLNAIRWDPDGNGTPVTSASSSYAAAFPAAATGMGCAATCAGYELRNDLDFDTNGNGYTHINGAGDSRDAYYNSGAGWDPIGSQSEGYDGTHYNVRLRGNGHLIKNLFINRSSVHRVGLFAQLREYAVITALGLPNAWVVGNTDVGVVAGILRGDIGGVWTSGRVSGFEDVGGIVGQGHSPAFSQFSEIRASYSTATVHCTSTSLGSSITGGIVSQSLNGTDGLITTSYFTGNLTGSCYKTGIQFGPPGNRPAVATYWNTSSGGLVNSDGAGRSTSALQTPTGYTGDYAVWDNQDVDFDGTTDTDPWDFGTSSQYPVLKFRGLDLHAQGRPFDYDDDNDNLIEIRTLPQLNAVRYDLNGDGVAASGATSTFIFSAAFPSPESGMGCQSTCAGYELRNDLDFDNNGSGAVDASDAFPNWAPIGGTYSATFEGNNRTISNLTIVDASGNAALFDRVSGTVRALGVADAEVSGVGGSTTEVAPLVSELTGTVIASWASGRARAGATGIPRVAGLVGRMSGSSALLSASYTTASVAGASNSVSFTGGLVASLNSGSQVVACYALGAVSGGGYVGGLIGGNNGPTTVTASYFAGSVAGGTSTAGVTGLDDFSGETYISVYFDAGTTGLASGTGRQTTSALQTPTTATGIYANWDDLDVNGNGTADEDPWHFGLANQYPVLTYGGLSAAPQLAAQPDTPPAFATSTLAAMTFPGNVAIQPFQLPVVTAGNGAYVYTPSGLPAGLSLGTSTCATARTVCGTPTAATSTTVTVTVDDGDSNMAAGDRDRVTFMVTVPAASARIADTTPTALMETNLSGASVVVELSGTVFGASVSPSGFQLATTPTIAGLSIASATRTSATSTTLGLRFDGTNFNTRSMLAVRVLAATHRFGGDQETGTVAVAPGVGVTLSATELALQEASGSNVGTYTVVLTGQPAGAVTVTPTSGNSDVTVGGALTFNAMNWNTAQTVTVTAGQDDDAVNDVAFITHGVQGIPGVASGPLVRVAVNDDDSQGLTLATSTLAAGVTEGMTGTYTARLASEPTGPVAVAIASSDGAVTVDVDAMADGEQATLLFNATNWDTAQTVTVRAGEDDDGEGETVTLTHDPSGADYGAVADAEATFAVTDNDAKGATLSATALNVQENGTATYTLVLDTQPVGGPVSVAVGIGSQTVATASPETLTFTTGNWDAPQTVTVSGVDDANTATEIIAFSHTPTGGGYDGVSISNINVTAVDDDVAGLKVSPTSLSVVEGGTATYTVRLNIAPTAAVTVTVGGATAKVTADTDRGTPGDQTTLAFDATNWNVAQTVTVAGVADVDGEDETVVLTHAVTGTGNYASLALIRRPGVSVRVEDGETAGVVVEPTSLTIAEGATAEYTVRLSAPPASGTSTVAVAATGMAGLTVATSSLVFNATTTLVFTGTTWNTAQTVTVTAVADHDRLADGAATLTHTATNYGAVMAGPDVRVTVRNTTVDHDADADGLIEIDSLAKLNAVRWDLDGDGTPAPTATSSYAAAFPNPRGGAACPSAVSGVACRGYELTADLDFDTDGDGDVDADDDHPNWEPIPAYGGSTGPAFQTTFRGNGHVIDKLTVRRPLSGGSGFAPSGAGLFGVVGASGRIESLGVVNASVEAPAGTFAGVVAGRLEGGRIVACYSTGSVSALGMAGGLVGRTISLVAKDEAHIVASYSTAEVSTIAKIGPMNRVAGNAGGLVGGHNNGAIVASYAAGPVVARSGPAYAGPQAGHGLSAGVDTSAFWVGAVRDSYWDTQATGQTTTYATSQVGVDGGDIGTGIVTMAGGQTTAQLQSPTDYDGIYATWNIDLDGDYAPDDPWDFGTSGQYPSLKWGGFDPARQFAVPPPAPAPDRGGPPAPVDLPPEALADLADASLDVGEALDIDLDGAFRDPEGGPLTHEAFSSDPGVASASAADGALRIEAWSVGAAEVTVTATDAAGLSASLSFIVRVGVAISFAADASAPEGGTIRLALVASRPAPRDLEVAYVLAEGGDPASAADASDHDGGGGGTVLFPAGAIRAELAIGIVDDDLAEPLREFFAAELTPAAADAGYGLGLKTTARATIEEGVCDRAAPLRDALRGRRDCAAVDDLSQLRVLNLAGRGVSALRPEDFPGLSGLRVLDLSNNRLSAWPSAALAGLPQLISLRLGGNRLEALPAGALAAHPQLLGLDLSGNRLAELPAGAFRGLSALRRLDLSGNLLAALDGELFAGLSGLRWLRLNGNLLSSLPAGLFAGVSGLEELQLQDNPGSPFVLRLELTRADGALWAPGPASLAARVVEGAPFAMRSVLKASGSVLPEAGVALAVPAGAVTGEAAAVPQDGAPAVAARLDGAPPVPDDECETEAALYRPCFQGLATAVGAPLILFKRPPGAAGPVADRTLRAGDTALRLDLSDWFDAAPGETLNYAAQSSDPSALRARIEDGELVLSPLAEGTATVTVTATDAYGLSATVRFEVQVTRTARSRWQGWRLILLEPEGDDGR